MEMVGRTFSASNAYRYGFNGQEKDDEIKGSGNNYNAEYWEYDSRLGRRWNRDPIVKVSESPYMTFGNNPILLRDPNGADTINMVRKTTFDARKYQAAASWGGGLDNYPAMHSPDVDGVTKSGSINIIAAEGEDVFNVVDVYTSIDKNGKETTISQTTTTLDIRGKGPYGDRNGGHNLVGYPDDRYALAANSPGWLLDYYANKNHTNDSPTEWGLMTAKSYQSDVPFAYGLNKVANTLYTISGVYGIVKASLSRSVVEAFPQGFMTSEVAGYYMRSASRVVNSTYQKTIQTLAYMGEDGAGSMLKVVQSIEVEARAAGAKTLEIHGVEIVNPKILSTAKVAAEKFGFTFEQVTNNSIKLTKQLK
jgi:RHS repeat-associated protein